MPRCVVAVVGCCMIASIVSAEQRETPYKAYIGKDDVYVRSGPGKNYYPSGKLQTGDQVDVYRHDPGGWFAIKPTDGSFAWVSARYVKVGEDGLAEITGDRVAARVGSRFSDIRDVIQVRLSRGEIVEILGQKEFKSASNSGIWYKIAPPSGEFRWVHGKYVDPDYLTSGVRTSRTGQSPLLGQVEAGTIEDQPRLLSTLNETEQPSPADKVSLPREPDEADVSAEVPSVAAKQPSSTEPTLATTVDETADDESVVRTADHWSPTTASSPAEVVRATPGAGTPRNPTGGAEVQASLTHRSKLIPELNDNQSGGVGDDVGKSFRAELSELELELSIMLAEEPTVWNFDEMRLGVRSLLANAETALERGRARGLARKVEQATDIKQRYDAVGDVIAKTDRHNRQLAQLSSSRADARAKLVGRTRNETKGRFDGIGRLARVVTPQVGSPSYALVGEKGNVTCYVTPAPGVNLHYYLGRQVGITGIRGILADQDVQHVTAKHIVEMSKMR